jgi:hypothetical protein
MKPVFVESSAPEMQGQLGHERYEPTASLDPGAKKGEKPSKRAVSKLKLLKIKGVALRK